MDIPQKQFKGVFIPAEIWEDEGLSWADKCLLGEIYSLTGKDGCYASNEYLAAKFRIAEGTMKNRISDLRKRGYLVTVKFDGRRRWLKTCWDMTPEVMKGMRSEVTETMTPEVLKTMTSEVSETMTHSNKKREKKKTKESCCNNDPFFDSFLDLQKSPTEVIDRLVEEAIEHGLPEDDVSEFLSQMSGRHFLIRPKSKINGLEKLVNNFRCFTIS